MPDGIRVEQPETIPPQRAPDSLDPVARVLREFYPHAVGRKASIAGELCALERRHNAAARHLKRGREIVGRRGPRRPQHRQAREVAARHGENVSRDIIEDVRGILQSRDCPSHGFRQTTSRGL
jgi:hypothetical protein